MALPCGSSGPILCGCGIAEAFASGRRVTRRLLRTADSSTRRFRRAVNCSPDTLGTLQLAGMPQAESGPAGCCGLTTPAGEFATSCAEGEARFALVWHDEDDCRSLLARIALSSNTSLLAMWVRAAVTQLQLPSPQKLTSLLVCCADGRRGAASYQRQTFVAFEARESLGGDERESGPLRPLEGGAKESARLSRSRTACTPSCSHKRTRAARRRFRRAWVPYLCGDTRLASGAPSPVPGFGGKYR